MTPQLGDKYFYPLHSINMFSMTSISPLLSLTEQQRNKALRNYLWWASQQNKKGLVTIPGRVPDGQSDGRVADLGRSRDQRGSAPSGEPPPRHDPQDL